MKNKTYLQKLIYTAFFAALTGVGAFISIPLPFTPVPITLQTLFVLLSGAVLGGTFGALSQIIYILLGIIGLPVFAGALTGPMVILGPTGGYLIGFIICAFVVGAFCGKLAVLGSAPPIKKPPLGGCPPLRAFHINWKSRLRGDPKVAIWFYFGVFAIGSVIIYIFGAAQLMLFMKISFAKAVMIGVLPFIFGDVLKIIAAAYLTEKIKKATTEGTE